MKFISELVEGERIESVYGVSEKQLRTTRSGKPFLSVRLTDKTGVIDAVAWDNAETLSARFEKGDLIGVRADTGSYQGTLQLTILDLKKVEKKQEYVTRTLPATDRDVEMMAEELKDIAASIMNSKVRELVKSFLDDPEFMASFSSAPAAKGMHHVFSGGLLQHTLKVTRLCVLIYEEYAVSDMGIASMISRDLLIAGAILHDMGKADELTHGPTFDYTTKGRLLGHITLGLLEVKKRIDATPGFPEDAADLLMHMLISHHGEYEYGSPKRPKCLEAMILHYADNLDAKLQGLWEFVDKDKTGGDFTSFHKLYDRYFYKGGVDLSEQDE